LAFDCQPQKLDKPQPSANFTRSFYALSPQLGLARLVSVLSPCRHPEVGRGLKEIMGLARFIPFLMLACAAASGPARAQTPTTVSPTAAVPSDPSGSVVVYDDNFFRAYGVVTARDMLERIPGMAGLFPAVGVQTEAKRGLRSETDQVLINGKRNTGKSSNVADYLERIPATQVLRIEVITGNVKEIDAAVGGRVVNVVLRTDKATGSGTFVAGFIRLSTGQSHPSGQLSYSVETGPWSATMGLETRARLQPVVVSDSITTPAGAQTARLAENRARDRQEYTGRARFGYSFPSGQNLQLSVFQFYYPQIDKDTSRRFDILPAGERQFFAVEDRTEGYDKRFEITSDYVLPLGSDSKFLALGVFNRNSVVRDSEIFNLFDFAVQQTAGDARDELRTEKILRGTYQTSFSKSQQFEIGVEGAITKLDKDLDFFNLVGGRRVDIRVFNSDTKITEDRVEVFSTYTWTPFEGVEVEPGLAAEFSWLDQSGGDVIANRKFKFFKPSLNAWYNLSERNRVFLSINRDVGQLTFEDFAASFIREDNELVAGNPNLVPEKAWVFELGNEYRFADDAGLLQLKGFYKRVQDVNDRVPLGPNFSGPGNLGSGKSYGVRLETSLKLAKLDLFDGVVSGTYLRQGSRVRDPFTGANRRFGKQPKYEATLNFRHDVQAWKITYGVEYSHFGPFIESDFGRFDRRATGGDARFFIERQLGRGLILRFFNGNAFRITNTRERTLFSAGQASGRATSVEYRREKPTHFSGVRLRGTF
jgi:outer membrane receptor for ferrienterochelin and colicins